jgi:glutathione peroxidase
MIASRLFAPITALFLLTATSGAEPADATLFDFEAKRLSGPVEPLAKYRGEVLLVVNTASKCGFTPQYEGLEALYERYRARGFAVLGFPSNDFREQEPGSDAEIGAFCEANYGVEFPMFSKVKVKGDDAHPLYAWLTSQPAPIGGPVAWNFQKYLVDREGRVVERFSPRDEPGSPEVVAAIERLLAAPAPDGGAAPAP